MHRGGVVAGLAAAGVLLAAAWTLLVAVAGPSLLWWTAAGAVPLAGLAVAVRDRAGPAVGALPRLRPSRRGVVRAVVAALAHAAVSYPLLAAAGGLFPLLDDQARAMVVRVQAVPAPVAVALVAVLIVPAEELFWRGTVQPLTGSTRWTRVAVTTGLFAGFHLGTGQLPLLAAAGLGGLIWGWLAEDDGSVGAPALAHGLWAVAMVLVPPA